LTEVDNGDLADGMDGANLVGNANCNANCNANWAHSVRGSLREMAAAMGCKGDEGVQLQLVRDVIARYPLTGFLIGASAAGPLVRGLYEAGRLEIHGFVVECVSDMAGIGKSTGNELAASIWGNPQKLSQTCDQTMVASEVLLNTMCDLPVFLEERQTNKKDSFAAQLVYSLALGMGRGRGNRNGGMRDTRQFFNIILLASEKSLNDDTSREGIGARVISLPPFFIDRTPEHGDEAERMRKQYIANYGHMGAAYMQYLMNAYNCDQWASDIVPLFDNLVERLKKRIPNDGMGEMISAAKRMATRVAACWLGLQLLFEAQSIPRDEAMKMSEPCADLAWKYIVDSIDGTQLWLRALHVIQSWAAENTHRIGGMEPISAYNGPRMPSNGYIGGLVKTHTAGECVGFYPTALEDVVIKHFNMEWKTIKQGLLREFVIVPDKTGSYTRFQRIASLGLSTRVICIPKRVIFPESDDGDDSD